uniref:Uncharacterized protein n=1 Tax=viral metagenome TaxID=1070528 RepID=A0A6C0ASY4_9ZZZZ
MASLTESSLIYDSYNQNNSNSSNSSPNNSNSNKNNWYDRVYLCVENKGDTQSIGKFHCYPFDSYEKADKYSKIISIYQNNKIRHTMVPMCKWIPNRFHAYFLNKTLKNMYWTGVKMM